MIQNLVRQNVPLRAYTTLRAGGPAEYLIECHSAQELSEAYGYARDQGLAVTLLGYGSNVLASDAGVAGLVIVNRATKISVAKTGEVVAETGAWLQDLFLRTAQAGLEGLSFAVGIPGSLGGALVSNAGAYRSCIGEFVKEVEIVDEAGCRWVDRDWMQFSYRDSVFRSGALGAGGLRAVMARVHLFVPPGDKLKAYQDAREFQRQRISKQPPSPSAGSFFKNVQDMALAADVPGLTPGMRESGVVPAGFLIEAVGLKGFRIGGAMLGVRHANFILNVGGATATDIRSVAKHAQRKVQEAFGVLLEEEAIYLGFW